MIEFEFKVIFNKDDELKFCGLPSEGYCAFHADIEHFSHCICRLLHLEVVPNAILVDEFGSLEPAISSPCGACRRRCF